MICTRYIEGNICTNKGLGINLQRNDEYVYEYVSWK